MLEVVDSVRAAVVMCESAATLLRDGYGIAADRVEVIPYGVPDLPIMPAESIKPSVGLGWSRRDPELRPARAGQGSTSWCSTPSPAIVKAHPNTTYVIVGATHPDVRLRDGEAYRISLAARAAKLGMTNHVRFVPEFVGRVELARWLQAADVFISPNPDLDTMVSGTLTYAMAAGERSSRRPTPTRPRCSRTAVASPRSRSPRRSPPR